MLNNKKESYLVTGGAGFIGSHIVEELVNQGRKVIVLDNLSTGKKENLLPFIHSIEFIEASILDLNLLKKIMKNVGYVFHQAAIPSVPRSIGNPIAANDANVSGTLNVLVAAKEGKVKRVVYASSSSVYGDNPVLPKKEKAVAQPMSPYAISKYAGELYCRVFANIYGLETVCLRYFNVFGPRQDPNSQYSAAIPKFIRALLENKPPQIYGDGLQSRDFTFVKNVVAANLLAAGKEGISGEVFNIACGGQLSVLDLINGIKRNLSKDIDPDFVAARVGEVKHSLADISKASKELGYFPEIKAEEGLKMVCDWYVNGGGR